MNCWVCNGYMIFGGNADVEGSDKYGLETKFNCPDCGAFVLVYHPIDKKDYAKKEGHRPE